MKKMIILFCLLGNVVAAQDQDQYHLSKEKSVLIWKARYAVIGGHEGTLQIVSGIVTTSGKRITHGEFIMDMNSIANTDIKPEEDGNGLENHLRSGDFFWTERYPTGTFVIQNAEVVKGDDFLVRGLLTLKDTTRSIEFPATISIANDIMKVYAVAKFDRTKFGITYQSLTFFSDLKDGVIADEVEVQLNLTLTKVSSGSR